MMSRTWVVGLVALVLCIPLAHSASGEAAHVDPHEKAKVECDACHRDSPKRAPPAAKCLACHGNDQAGLAAKTASVKPNPHASPHLAPDETQQCSDCHHEHRESEVQCIECHGGFKFNLK